MASVPFEADGFPADHALPVQPRGTIYPQIGESARNSKPYVVDVQNLQSLDALYHPIAIETLVPAPAPTAGTVRVAQVGGSFTETEMRQILTAAGWPAELHDQALRVSWCESKWSNASGDRSKHPDELGKPLSVGIMQMGVAGWRWLRDQWVYWNGWFRFYGYEDEQALDPVINATVAYLAYQRSGWGPWSCKP